MHTLRIRGKGYPATGFSPINNTYPIAIWDSDDLQLHVWLEAESYSGTPGIAYNIDDITSLAMEMRATPDTSTMLIEAKTTSSFTACTLDEFINGTGQHATFTFTDTDTNVASTLDQVWISLVATLDDGSRYTFAAGYVQVIHSGADQSAVVDAVDTYARYTFKTISVSGQSDVIADTATDTLTLAGSNGVVITTSAGTDTITFSLGAITPTTVNGLTITTSTGTLTVTNGKTLSASNTLTFAGTDGSTLNVGTGGTLGSAAFTASSAYQPASSTYVTAAAALASTDNCIIRGDASSTRGIQATEWLIDDTGAMSYTLIGDELTALSILSLGTNATTLTVAANGTGAVALDGTASGTNGVGVQGGATHATGIGVRGYGTASGSVGVLAQSSHASAIPLQVMNSGGFRVSITSAATANRSQILPDEAGTFALREWATGTLPGLGYVNVRDEFNIGNTTAGAIGDWGWSGANLTISIRGSEERHPGIVRFTSGGTTLGGTWCGYNAASGPDALNGLTLEGCFRLVDIDNLGFFFGLGYVNTWESGNGGYRGLHYDSALSANWRVLHRSNVAGGTSTYVDTGVAAVAGDWVYVKIVFTNGNTEITIKTTSTPAGATVSGTASYANTGGNCAIEFLSKSSSGTNAFDVDAVALYGSSTRL